MRCYEKNTAWSFEIMEEIGKIERREKREERREKREIDIE